jgi:hypothetical protein
MRPAYGIRRLFAQPDDRAAVALSLFALLNFHTTRWLFC